MVVVDGGLVDYDSSNDCDPAEEPKNCTECAAFDPEDRVRHGTLECGTILPSVGPVFDRVEDGHHQRLTENDRDTKWGRRDQLTEGQHKASNNPRGIAGDNGHAAQQGVEGRAAISAMNTATSTRMPPAPTSTNWGMPKMPARIARPPTSRAAITKQVAASMPTIVRKRTGRATMVS